MYSISYSDHCETHWCPCNFIGQMTITHMNNYWLQQLDKTDLTEFFNLKPQWKSVYMLILCNRFFFPFHKFDNCYNLMHKCHLFKFKFILRHQTNTSVSLPTLHFVLIWIRKSTAIHRYLATAEDVEAYVLVWHWHSYRLSVCSDPLFRLKISCFIDKPHFWVSPFASSLHTACRQRGRYMLLTSVSIHQLESYEFSFFFLS